MTISVPADVISRLKAVLGEGGWSQDPDRVAPKLVEWRGRWTGTTPLLALPKTTAQVAAVVGICAETLHRVGAPATRRPPRRPHLFVEDDPAVTTDGAGRLLPAAFGTAQTDLRKPHVARTPEDLGSGRWVRWVRVRLALHHAILHSSVG